jgi:hypothetical protein
MSAYYTQELRSREVKRSEIGSVLDHTLWRLSPSLSPEGMVRYTLIFINSTTKYRPQDEPLLRSATLYLYLTVYQNPLI